eukprot:CAMPEP_0185847916 /NCGR_PEP_ID=MMETSP1354-20130828/2989_1 /TAXON_ID=708628 /ORGANISM="Erythrolobus madagascarensis, Strain CCMP3276" /LENGTH=360 /DNA_ID=CAMNT_0028548251 /DNA_START=206 /DNA_END=1284 /DNA_ORIENTATION=-
MPLSRDNSNGTATLESVTLQFTAPRREVNTAARADIKPGEERNVDVIGEDDKDRGLARVLRTEDNVEDENGSGCCGKKRLVDGVEKRQASSSEASFASAQHSRAVAEMMRPAFLSNSNSTSPFSQPSCPPVCSTTDDPASLSLSGDASARNVVVRQFHFEPVDANAASAAAAKDPLPLSSTGRERSGDGSIRMVKRARDVREEVLVEEDESVKEGGDARSVVESGGWELQCFLCRAQFSSRTELREHAESSHIGAAADQQKKRQNIVAARMDRSPDSADEGLALLRHEREEGCIGTGAECASQDAARRRLSWMLASMEKRRQLPASVSPAVSPDLGESRPVSCTQCTEQFMTLRELKRHA